jgi:hypothetical protein
MGNIIKLSTEEKRMDNQNERVSGTLFAGCNDTDYITADLLEAMSQYDSKHPTPAGTEWRPGCNEITPEEAGEHYYKLAVDTCYYDKGDEIPVLPNGYYQLWEDHPTLYDDGHFRYQVDRPKTLPEQLFLWMHDPKKNIGCLMAMDQKRSKYVYYDLNKATYQVAGQTYHDPIILPTRGGLKALHTLAESKVSVLLHRAQRRYEASIQAENDAQRKGNTTKHSSRKASR